MPDTARDTLTVGQVTARTGLSPDALRFYERQGLLPEPIGRTASGRRAYTEDDVRWLENCVRFRASGMPVAAIRSFAELVRDGPGNEDRRLELLVEHERVVVERIAELTGCLDLIRDKVATYRASLADGAGTDPWSPPGR